MAKLDQQNKDEAFELIGLNRDEEPKSEWWFWTDKLDELTTEQRNTL